MSNKKLKKAIRERMKRTGERYTTARMHVLAKLKTRIDDGTGPTPFSTAVLPEEKS